MAHGGGAAGQQEFEYERAAHVVGNTDHDRMLAAYWKVRIGQQCHHSFRGTRAQTALAKHQAPDVFRLETIHVFLRIDAVDQGIGIDMCRQRQLHEDSVDGRVRVESIDQRRQFGFRRVGWQIEIMGSKTNACAGTPLVAHVDRGRCLITDQHHCQTGANLACLHARADPRGEPIQQFIGNALAVQQPCLHCNSCDGARIIPSRPRRLKHLRTMPPTAKRIDRQGAQPSTQAGTFGTVSRPASGPSLESPFLFLWTGTSDPNSRSLHVQP
jgi:hypothetical protein